MVVIATTPERSLQQRRDALRKANRIRGNRKELKAELKAGTKNVPDLLVSPPDWLLTMKVFDLLLAQPGWGVVKTGKLLKRLGVSPGKSVEGISDRQRAELVETLCRWLEK